MRLQFRFCAASAFRENVQWLLRAKYTYMPSATFYSRRRRIPCYSYAFCFGFFGIYKKHTAAAVFGSFLAAVAAVSLRPVASAHLVPSVSATFPYRVRPKRAPERVQPRIRRVLIRLSTNDQRIK